MRVAVSGVEVVCGGGGGPREERGAWYAERNTTRFGRCSCASNASEALTLSTQAINQLLVGPDTADSLGLHFMKILFVKMTEGIHRVVLAE